MRKVISQICSVSLFTVLLLLASSWYGGSLHAQQRERYGVTVLADPSTLRVLPPLFPAMRDAGIRWATAQFDRELIHIGPQQYDWSSTDATVAAAAANGVLLVGQLGASPLWDTTEPGITDYYTYPPRDYNQWADYVFQTVSRYRNQVRYWEVWTEPDIPPPAGWWNATPGEYARLLAVVYREVKRADPTAQVLIGGFLDMGSQSLAFFQAIMADPINPAGQNFDIMSIHAYWTQQEARNKVIFWRSMTTKPLWVTEMGWPANPQLQQSFDPAFCCGEEAQARFLRTVMADLVSLGAEKVFWFALWSPESVWPEFDTLGLLDANFTPRQAYGALRDLLASLPP